jgi:hypothetical protein
MATSFFIIWTGDWITVVTRATGTFTGKMILPDQLIVISAFRDSAQQRQQIGLA